MAGDFHARFDPLEIIDNHDHVVARGGRSVLLGGGYFKSADARSLGHQSVFFCAWKACEADNPVRARKRSPGHRGSFRDTRLPTTEQEVAHLSAAVAQACAQTAWARTGFICRVRRKFSADGFIETFLAAFVVPDLPSHDSRQLLALLPSSMRHGGINVLTESAVPHSEPLGVQVYERGEHGQTA